MQKLVTVTPFYNMPFIMLGLDATATSATPIVTDMLFRWPYVWRWGPYVWGLVLYGASVQFCLPFYEIGEAQRYSMSL